LLEKFYTINNIGQNPETTCSTGLNKHNLNIVEDVEKGMRSFPKRSTICYWNKWHGEEEEKHRLFIKEDQFLTCF